MKDVEARIVIEDFNLLATTMRGTERDACTELFFLLQKIGDSEPKVGRTGISGLIAARTALSPLDVIGKFRQILLERPYEFRYTFRIIPIEQIVRTDLEHIRSAAAELSSRIGKTESFRVTVEKRFTSLSSKAIVEASAEPIKRKVDLSAPDKVLLIEVVGKLTGLSLLNPDGVLSVLKEKAL